MSNMIEIEFSDGRKQKYPKGITVKNVADSISKSLKKNAIVGKVDENLVDLNYEFIKDAKLSILSLESEEALHVLRHSAAHILAQAVKRLYNNVQLGIGPAVKDGFYYDFRLEKNLTPEDLLDIEKEMENIINENLGIQRYEVSYEEARKLFEEANELYKLEILKDIPKNEFITIYKQGEFIDLCQGPHIPSTRFLKAFKLTSVSGAYWKGDSQNEVFQRVYGVAFKKKKDLNDYMDYIKEAERRDHRKLGKQLDLFMFSEEAPGMPFYLSKGQTIRNELEIFLRELQDNAYYDEVRTPYMMNQKLWERSGHWDHYHENMYFSEVDHTKFAIKPMNCPGHMMIFKDNHYSYRELPIRMAEFGQVHRHEYSGALNGLLRVRTFCQDDAHIFVREDQIESEIKNIFSIIHKVYDTFNFSYSVELSTRPKYSLGNDQLWEISEGSLKSVLKDLDVNYELNEGDGAFYGPKIDFHIKDALNRSHQCATIQLDFQMPEKFDLNYINEDNNKIRPVVIHRAIFGSIDRFLGILIEHFAGAFPIWIAPIQVQIIPVSPLHVDHCFKIQSKLKQQGIRVKVDSSNEKVGFKIRKSQLQKIPYMLVIGDSEVENGMVNVRKYGEEKSAGFSIEAFENKINEQIKKRSL